MSGPPPAAAGTLVLSFDTEQIWGSFDHTAPDAFMRRYPDEVGTVRDLIGLLDRHAVPATWAVVGHLFLRACHRGTNGEAHPELVHPRQSWWDRDWLAADPCTDLDRDPVWYGTEMLEAIEAARTPQEIGSHSFSHPLFDDPEMAEDAARSEIEACMRLARARGIELRSFVFPRNREGHHQLLRDAGFTAFRGADPVWHARLPGPAGRIGHLLDQAAGIGPPVSVPTERLPGLWNIPGSMMLMNGNGPRRFMTRRARVTKALHGLRRAVSGGAVFHLWTHPFNIAADRQSMLEDLDRILAEAATLRERGALNIEPMAAVARRMAAGASS
jgi:peptidoglycan/xylan/chitin deacetylase (PgdA/CDA1 family)